MRLFHSLLFASLLLAFAINVSADIMSHRVLPAEGCLPGYDFRASEKLCFKRIEPFSNGVKVEHPTMIIPDSGAQP